MREPNGARPRLTSVMRLPKSLQFLHGAAILDEVLRAVVRCRLQGVRGLRTRGAHEVKLADVELRLATLAGPGGRIEQGVGRAPPQEQLHEGIRPVAGLQLAG